MSAELPGQGAAQAPFRFPLRPRYLEVDRLGIVFNMWYLGYFDDALAAFLAARGLPYPQYLDAGYDLALVRTEIDWSTGLRFGDEAEIEVTVHEVRRTSFTLGFEVLRRGESLCRCRTVYVVVAADGSGKREIMPELMACLRPA